MAIELMRIKASELTGGALGKLVHEKKSFIVDDVADISEVVAMVEKYVEIYGLSCRVYTEYRAAALGAGLLIGGLGAVAGVGIAAHNLVTWNPDYEIGKNKFTNSVTVIYKKYNNA